MFEPAGQSMFMPSKWAVLHWLTEAMHQGIGAIVVGWNLF